ncbi:hypothetical protein AMR71_01295 [Bacillus altitudinis]|nr:hypothetical protein AMR71_01295 [Bacillus altitudinis]ANY95402.1 hypothetical protein AKO66_01295 [Bacillus altitudinis]
MGEHRSAGLTLNARVCLHGKAAQEGGFYLLRIPIKRIMDVRQRATATANMIFPYMTPVRFIKKTANMIQSVMIIITIE